MKKIFVILLFCLMGLSSVPANAKGNFKYTEAPVKTQLEKRTFQTRMFDCSDKALVMKAMLNVLQDEGFIVNNANPLLGFISGVKEFDVSDKSIDIGQEFGTNRASLAMQGIKVATIEATANITEYGKQMRVRITFKRKLLNMYGNAQIINEIGDAKYYQEFFSEVDKAIFIQTQKI